MSAMEALRQCRDLIVKIYMGVVATSDEIDEECRSTIAAADAVLAQPAPTVTLPPLPKHYTYVFDHVRGYEADVIAVENVRVWRDQIIECLRAAGVEVT